jgi:hypothetical protein
MAIIDCPGCGESVSDGSPYCPHCGAPVLEMRPPRIRPSGPQRLRPGYRVALLLGIVLMPLSTVIVSKAVFVLGALSFLIGAGGMVAFHFRKDRFDEDE